ncbi:hypothetical protein HBA92_12605 [Ochrobactrum sp. MR28]|nr:hypothetical protein [Ochrobactrum sp. MR28]MBX8818526.1 hypothetical protein [Ochrobactrum sp. MR31]
MMNPTEIADALDDIARAPFDAAEFGFSEPPRLYRRPFGLSYAAMAGASSMA